MNIKEIGSYSELLEKRVIERGIADGIFSKEELVSARPGRLAKTRFGRSLGQKCSSDLEFVVDYYGYLKKSDGLLKSISKLQSEMIGKQVKMVSTIVVHFASLKIEEVARISQSPRVVAGFPLFKNELLEMKGFIKNQGG
jgi:hypothetical protein